MASLYIDTNSKDFLHLGMFFKRKKQTRRKICKEEGRAQIIEIKGLFCGFKDITWHDAVGEA